MAYSVPDDEIVAIIDAPPPPATTLSPDGTAVLLVHYESHPPIELLARPFVRLGGVRVDPARRSRQRVLRLVGITVVDVADGSHRPVPLPPDTTIGMPVWAPDSAHFAFMVDEPDHLAVWVGDRTTARAAVVPGLVVSDVLTGGQLGGGGPLRWSRDSRSLYAFAVPDGNERSALDQDDPIEPHIEETIGKATQMATFQDLLRSVADEGRFEDAATTQLVRVDVASGAVSAVGSAGLLQSVKESPDGRYVLVDRLTRPFSFRVPYPYFARRTEVWSHDGELTAVIADLPVSDEVPRQGVPLGPRSASWEERAPATLVWTEALDGGDPMAVAEHRDRVMRAVPPFTRPVETLRTQHRCLGWWDLDEPGGALVVEYDRDRRWRTTWRVQFDDAGSRTVLFDLSANDAYNAPGTPLMRRHADGAETVRQVGTSIFLAGPGATPEGDRPFLTRWDLADGTTERLHVSPPGCLEHAVAIVDDGAALLVRREGPTEPPNLVVVPFDTSQPRRVLTDYRDPHPQLTGMNKVIRTHHRPDGVALNGVLHLPPGHDPERDGPLPLVIWAYPLDFSDAGTAGQVRGSDQGFTRLSALGPIWFVMRGYAVLSDATMPIIGDPETMNDTYIEQVTDAARAHIDALDADGIIDRSRVIVGGHSYGGFMTANLLAHTDLFAAGIARSGAYNRSLTPFGFQTERRTFWEAPQIYDAVSPFRYAHQISAPILLVHGAEDSNPGTFTVQSERLFQALQGNGATARLVLLPHESHGYQARESVLHVLAEQFAWADRWAPAKPR